MKAAGLFELLALASLQQPLPTGSRHIRWEVLHRGVGYNQLEGRRTVDAQGGLAVHAEGPRGHLGFLGESALIRTRVLHRLRILAIPSSLVRVVFGELHVLHLHSLCLMNLQNGLGVGNIVANALSGSYILQTLEDLVRFCWRAGESPRLATLC